MAGTLRIEKATAEEKSEHGPANHDRFIAHGGEDACYIGHDSPGKQARHDRSRDPNGQTICQIEHGDQQNDDASHYGCPD